MADRKKRVSRKDIIRQQQEASEDAFFFEGVQYKLEKAREGLKNAAQDGLDALQRAYDEYKRDPDIAHCLPPIETFLYKSKTTD